MLSIVIFAGCFIILCLFTHNTISNNNHKNNIITKSIYSDYPLIYTSPTATCAIIDYYNNLNNKKEEPIVKIKQSNLRKPQEEPIVRMKQSNLRKSQEEPIVKIKQLHHN